MVHWSTQIQRRCNSMTRTRKKRLPANSLIAVDNLLDAAEAYLSGALLAPEEMLHPAVVVRIERARACIKEAREVVSDARQRREFSWEKRSQDAFGLINLDDEPRLGEPPV